MMHAHGLLIFCTIATAIVSAAFVLLMSNNKTPKWLDIISSISLLAFSAFYVGLLQSVVNFLPKETLQQNELVAQYQTAILIIPFFTAALASNLLTHVILSSRDYNNTITLSQALKIIGKYIFIIILMPTGIGLMYYVAYVKWVKSQK